MSESEFRKALLRGEEPVDVETMTYRVLRRDRRRIWILGIVCVIAWILVVMLPWAFLMPAMAKALEHQQQIAHGEVPHLVADQENHRVDPAIQPVVMGTMYTFVSNVICMFVAAVSTVLLIVASRRATLRQVNARLAEISARLSSNGGNRP